MTEKFTQPDLEKERFLKLADDLDVLQKKIAHERGVEGGSFSHVDYIVSNLRKGDLVAAKRDYEQQSDKFGGLGEIVKFLEDNGVAEKFDFNKFK